MTTEIEGALATLGRQAVIAELVDANERLWTSWVASEDDDLWDKGDFICRSYEDAATIAFPSPSPYRKAFTAVLESDRSSHREERAGGTGSKLPLKPRVQPKFSEPAPSKPRVQPRLFEPDAFVASIVPEIREDDRRYFVAASLRAKVQCTWSAQLRRTFVHLSSAIDEGPRVLGYRDLRARLTARRLDDVSEEHHRQYVDVYMGTLRNLRFIVPLAPRAKVRVVAEQVDAEYVVAALFGVSTGIMGLDQLFGGFGPILAHNQRAIRVEPDWMRRACLPGRFMLVRGRFGTGKSLLACCLAASIARKGGLVNIISIEHEPQEYAYMLSTMGLLPNRPGFVIGNLQDGSGPCPASPGEGSIVCIRANRHDLPDSLTMMRSVAERSSTHPLRLLVVDSLNGVASLQGPPDPKDRAMLRRAFREITNQGTHILLIEEEHESENGNVTENEYLADTVVRLFTTREQNYSKRFIQILKCRFQREQRGDHHFTIGAGTGINVIPSPVAVRTRIAQRRPQTSRHKKEWLNLGVGSLGALVGTAPVRGQTIVVEGRPGTQKSALADAILATSTRPHEGADGRLFVGEPRKAILLKDRPDPVLTRFVPRGFNSPGAVFQELDRMMLHFRQYRGFGVLVIDDVAAFDLDAPLVATDPSFGHILVDYLRRQDLVTVLVMRRPEAGEPDAVRRAIVDDADYHLRLVRITGGSFGRVLLSVARSPQMAHRAGWFELTDRHVSSAPAFVNIRGDEEHPVRVALFLFADTRHHYRYNVRIAALLRANSNAKVSLDRQDRICAPSVARFWAGSTPGDARVVQLDEYQLPDDSRQGPDLWSFEATELKGAYPIAGSLEGPWKRATLRGLGADATLRGLPFYCNIGFLVYRQEFRALVDAMEKARGAKAKEFAEWARVRDQFLSPPSGAQADLDWRMLAFLSDEFEVLKSEEIVEEVVKKAEFNGSKKGRISLFQHAGWTDENYNVLFLEILLWVRSAKTGDGRNLGEALSSEDAIEAALILRRLCRASYDEDTQGVDREQGNPRGPFVIRESRTEAFVWRQWFTTLTQLCASLNPRVVRNLSVRLLPGTKPGDCSVSGDWFLGVLSDSALPECGLHLIKLLTDESWELERLRKGIGLPTRARFYETAATEGVSGRPERVTISPQLSLDASRHELREALENAFRRSSIHRYAALAPMLSLALRNILEFAASPDLGEPAQASEIAAFIERTLRAVRARRVHQADSTIED
jgi:KaiC/GvpD/RAD55 family RecA-like ATPase